MRTLQRFAQFTILIATLSHPAVAQTMRAESDDSAGTRGKGLTYAEIGGFLVLLNAYDRFAYRNEMFDGKKVFSSTFSSSWDHLRKQTWVWDTDPFNVNQFEHPYLGATLFGIARSTGHSFWKSAAYADAGSFAWEMAGETTPPSLNDLITTGQAGTLLGEAFYRIADLVLKDGGEKPPWWHEYVAAIVSPPTAFNRRMLGKSYKPELPDSSPATAWQARLGASGDAVARDVSTPGTLLRRDATAEFAVSYGLPGRAGYNYTRPLDYFDLEVSLLSSRDNPVENVMLRGLLIGQRTGDGDNSRGIWGLYGSYDYISPFLFRVSSTALSLGTTRQYNLAPSVALQGSLLGGVGFGAAGTTNGFQSTSSAETIRDYHYGVTPQALMALRLIVADRAMFDMTTREYYVSGVGSDDTRGSETIFRGNFGVNLRVVGGHTIGVRYVHSMRDAKYGSLPDNHLTEGTVSAVYSFLGANHFGAVKW